MKSMLRRASVLLPLLLAACASTQGTAHWSKPVDARVDGPATSTDAAYMARVEAIALQRGVQVVWINPPREARKSGND